MSGKQMIAKVLMDVRLETAWIAIGMMVIPKGYICVSTFTDDSKALIKIGDGVSTWTALKYLNEADPIDLSNYYTKTETDSAITTAINQAVSGVFTIKGRVNTVNDLPTTGNKKGDVYLVGTITETNMLEYYWNDTYWDFMGSTSTVDLSGYYKNTEVDALLATKVTTVEGKGLSSEDFTLELKTKLEGLSNYDDTALANRVTAIEDDYIKSSDTLVLVNTLD